MRWKINESRTLVYQGSRTQSASSSALCKMHIPSSCRSPKANHREASQPHFPHFLVFVSAFSTLSLCGICSDPCVCGMIRSFEKGLAGRGGWHEEILPVPDIQTSFLCPSSCATLGDGEHNSGDQFSLCFGTRSSPIPSRQPLFSEDRGCLEEGCLGLPGVLPDISSTPIFPGK